MNTAPILHVSLLGPLSIRCGDGDDIRVISEQDSSSRRLWSFLGYLLAFHKKQVSQEELIDVLWEDASVALPANALKTLLHRTRQMLETLGVGDGKQLLLYRRGIYSWSPHVTLEIDIEQFEALAAIAEHQNDPEAALAAIQIYQGDFLPSSSSSPWTVSLRTYYHARYLRLCAAAASALQDQKRFREAVDVCRRATTLDPYDETCHLLLMQSLSSMGMRQAALQHYTEVSQLFTEQLGVPLSDALTKLYQELSKAGLDGKPDLHMIRQDLTEPGPFHGVFHCDYPVFREIYQLESRTAHRNGYALQLALLTVLSRTHQELPPEIGTKIMDQMSTAISNSLRSGDVYTKLAPSQFLILLPTASQQTGYAAIQRVLEAFFSYDPANRLLDTSVELLPMLPTNHPACATI